ncbi:MAG: hypothetical protein JNM84_15245 [Planctomycetes bacterium]|nr:hypothetical protein [Planctomycetota bacterium]
MSTRLPFQLPRLLRIAGVALLIACAVPELRAQQTTQAIGAVGSTLVLDARWKRVGSDTRPEVQRWVHEQRSSDGRELEPLELELREHQTCVECPADARRVLDTLLAEGRDVELELSSVAGFKRASRTFTQESAGRERRWILVLVYGDALAYSVIASAPREREAALLAAADELLNGLRWPAEDSAWSRDLVPREQRVAIGSFELGFQVRPAALREAKPGPGEEWRALAPDETQGLVVRTSYLSDDEHALFRECARLRAEEPDLVAGAWRPTRIGELEGSILDAHSSQRTHRLLSLRIDANLGVVLRYWSPGAPEEARAERERCFSSLRIAPLSADLPPIPAESSRFQVEHAPLLRELLSRGELLARAPSDEVRSVRRVAPQTWLLENFGTSRVLDASGARPIPGGDLFPRSHALWQGRWISARNRELSATAPDARADGEVEPIDAQCLHVVGDELLLSRSTANAPLLDLESRYGGWSSTIVRRTPTGAEQILAELRDVQVTQMQVDEQGHRLALRADQRGRQLGETQCRLLVLELATGALRSLGIWRELRCFGPAPRGWLVTGRPPLEPYGIWQIVEGEPPRLLVASREVLGVALDAEHLEFGLSTTAGYELHRIGLAEVAKMGPRIEPFAPEDLDLLGERMFAASAAPGTAREIERVLARVQADARELCGAELPTAARECDRLLQSMHFAGGMGYPGRALCALLNMRALLARRAVWIDEPEPTWAAWVGPGARVESSLFDLPLLAPNGVRLALDDSEGYDWPCDTARREARGRTILLGLSAERLLRATAERMPSGFAAALENVDTAALLALLRAHERNYLLRERIYEHLAHRGEAAAVAVLAQPFAASSRGAAEAELWARSQVPPTPAQAAELIELALEVLRRHPESDVASYHLAAACERADPPRLELARAAYARAARKSWSAVGRAAVTALERWKR